MSPHDSLLFFAAIRQEQFLHQGDDTVDALFNQLSAV
jgi:hypothetical protein